jgi:hypothetical protein
MRRLVAVLALKDELDAPSQDHQAGAEVRARHHVQRLCRMAKDARVHPMDALEAAGAEHAFQEREGRADPSCGRCPVEQCTEVQMRRDDMAADHRWQRFPSPCCGLARRWTRGDRLLDPTLASPTKRQSKTGLQPRRQRRDQAGRVIAGSVALSLQDGTRR